MKPKDKIKENINLHNEISESYEDKHDEIFNTIEQDRLKEKLKLAIKNINTKSKIKNALDYGCGSGNLTRHLISLGLHTTSADVTDSFLSLINKKFSKTDLSETLLVNGYDLSNIKDNTFDFVSTYSVLHHVPDYLTIVEEMVRILKPGGILYIDHEVNENYWNQTKKYIELQKTVKTKDRSRIILANLKSLTLKRCLKLLKPGWYFNKIRSIINPKLLPEGDIHVWADDHIEWDKIKKILVSKRCKTVLDEDYLLYRLKYPVKDYKRYYLLCDDMKLLIARKK